jgi:hypothetical protein
VVGGLFCPGVSIGVVLVVVVDVGVVVLVVVDVVGGVVVLVVVVVDVVCLDKIPPSHPRERSRLLFDLK